MNIAYQTYGAETNTPLVLIHPFPFDHRLWEQVARSLSANYFVVTPDIRGCGGSALGSQEPNLDLVAEDILDLLNDLNLTEVVLGGISLGGYVAMAIARLKPQLLTGLILVDTKASSDSETARENRIRVAQQMTQSGKVELFAEQMLTTVVGKYTHENRPEVVAQVKSWMLDANAKTIAWLQLAMANRPASFDSLAALNVPTLLIRGAEDQISTTEDFLEMEKKLRQVTFVQIANSGHLPPIEDPIATTAAIGNWLSTFVDR